MRVALISIFLKCQENLLNYIGGLHSYLFHTILDFNSSDLDQLFVQAQHLEAHGKSKNKDKDSTKKPQGDEKVNAISKKKGDGKKVHRSHCDKDGHDDEKCWKLHPKCFPYKKKKDDDKKNASLTKMFSEDNFEDYEKL